MRAAILTLLAGGALLAGCSTTETTAYREPAIASDAGVRITENDARIPFVQSGGIRDWRTANDHEIYIQASSQRWYRAELMGPCNGLEFSTGVRFLPSDPAGTFDRFSSIVANGQRCQVQSLVELSGEPAVPNHPRLRYRTPSSS